MKVSAQSIKKSFLAGLGGLILPVLLALSVAGVSGLFPGGAAAQAVVQPIGNLINTWTVGQANEIAKLFDSTIIPGVTDPFGGGVAVTQIDPTRTLHFVRFCNSPADKLGGWIMRTSEVRGLTPQQIANKFALPNGTAPRYIVSVDVPASPAAPNKYGLLTGIAGPIAGWGQGGGQQTRIIKGQTSDATYDFMDYSRYIPASSYYHLQFIGDRALVYAPRVGGNASRVGAYLDTFIPQAYSDLEYVYESLDFLNWSDFGPEPLSRALSQIGPERFDSLVHLGVRNSMLFGNALLDRSQSLRYGLASSTSWSRGWSSLVHLAYAGGVGDLKAVWPSSIPSQSPNRGVGVWARGLGEFGDQSSKGERTGFDYRTGGVVGGVDFQPRPDVIIGFGTAYLGSDLNWNADGGNAKVSNAKFGVYGSFFTSRFFLDAAVSGGVNWTGAQRRIVFEGVDRTADSSQTGSNVDVHLRGGVNFRLAGWDLTPMAGLAYYYLNQDPFTETGADSLNLSVDDNTAHTMRSLLALRLARTLAAAEGVKLVPEAALGWAHEFPLNGRTVTAGLAEIPGSFAVNGFDGSTDSLLAGAGLTALLAQGVALSARYDLEIRRGFNAHLVNLGVRYVF